MPALVFLNLFFQVVFATLEWISLWVTEFAAKSNFKNRSTQKWGCVLVMVLSCGQQNSLFLSITVCWGTEKACEVTRRLEGWRLLLNHLKSCCSVHYFDCYLQDTLCHRPQRDSTTLSASYAVLIQLRPLLGVVMSEMKSVFFFFYIWDKGPSER